MPVWNAENAHCFVYAYKEGLLAAAGHDVKLKVGDFEVVAGRSGVRGHFDATSLTVVCAMSQGQDNPGALSDGDRSTIEGYVRDDILQTEEHPEITWTTTRMRRDGQGRIRVQGDLTLHGRTKTVKATVEEVEDRLVARARIRQPEFGIKPFSALMGALKIKPVVEVELSVPATTDLPTE